MLVFAISTISPAAAQGEHGRRAAAELQVVIADLRKLKDIQNSGKSTLLINGLLDRINGGLSALDILFRLADAETNKPMRSYADDLKAARELIRQNRLSELELKLANLRQLFPLKIPSISVSEQNLDQAKIHHNDLCMACHDNPIENVERPAYNLYQQATSESDVEFFARMLVGVRGDRVTGIDNPFTDIQLMSLISLYKKGNH